MVNPVNLLKRWLQLRVIRSLTESLPKEGWWLFGGWIDEAISGVKKPHRDIDLFVMEGVDVPPLRWLDIHRLSPTDDPEILVERAIHGTFYISRKGLREEPYDLAGIRVKGITHELRFCFARGAAWQILHAKQLSKGANRWAISNISLILSAIHGFSTPQLLRYEPL